MVHIPKIQQSSEEGKVQVKKNWRRKIKKKELAFNLSNKKVKWLKKDKQKTVAEFSDYIVKNCVDGALNIEILGPP